MKVIDLKTPRPASTTVLLYGASKSGKTRFAATAPDPIFLSDAVEGGYETIRSIDPNDFYTPGKLPDVWTLESVQDMKKAQAELRVSLGKYKTVVIDSLTFYVDLAWNWILKAGPKDRNGEPDTLRGYGMLWTHLQDTLVEIHRLGLNVIWICLEKPPEEGRPIGGPMIPGQGGQKIPAACNYVWYQRAYQHNPSQPPIFETRTKKFGAFMAGGRDEGRLPDPLPTCSWRAFEEALWGEKQKALPNVQTHRPPVVSSSQRAPVMVRR